MTDPPPAGAAGPPGARDAARAASRGTSAARLRDLAGLFLTLGTVGFGGPAAHIALMENAVVRRRRWLTRAEFLDYLSATHLIPGPNSTELALHIGRARAGWPGLVVAGTCFILPAALIVGGLAWAYGRYGALPAAAGLLRGVKPVVIAVVVHALWGFGRSAVTSPRRAALGVAALVATALGAHELAVLGAAGAASALWRRAPAPGPGLGRRRDAAAGWLAPTLAAPSAATPVAVATAPLVGAGTQIDLAALFGVFAKTGAVLFGSGYVLVAFLRADLVERLGWLTERQLLDAVAVGQVTPGPVFTTATFVGYVLGGPAGAAAATVGIFLPAFVLVALSGPLVPRLRASPTAGAALDGVNVASLALMAVAAAHLGRAALVDPLTVALAAASALLLVRWRVNPAWLLLGGAAVGTVAGAGLRPWW